MKLRIRLIGLLGVGVSVALVCSAIVLAEEATNQTRSTRRTVRRVDAASESSLDQDKLERKLDKILANQERILNNQAAILQKLDAVMEELRIIKVRATLRSG